MKFVFLGRWDHFAAHVFKALQDEGKDCIAVDENRLWKSTTAIFHEDSRDIEFDEIIINARDTIFTNSFPWISDKDDDNYFFERKRSEWSAFLYACLVGRHNTLNPPSRGHWPGYQPTAIDLISTFNNEEYDDFELPSFNELKVTWPTNLLPSGYPYSLRTPKENIIKIFFLKEILVPSCCLPEAIINQVNLIISRIKENLNIIMGEVGFTRGSHGKIYLQYVFNRPQTAFYQKYFLNECLKSSLSELIQK